MAFRAVTVAFGAGTRSLSGAASPVGVRKGALVPLAEMHRGRPRAGGGAGRGTGLRLRARSPTAAPRQAMRTGLDKVEATGGQKLPS